MSGHTKGPWLLTPRKWFDAVGNIVQDGQYDISVNSADIKDDDYYRIATVNNFADSPENKANARLIAAAPDLPEALQRLMNGTTSLHDAMQAAQQARAAIAKATGEGA